MSSGQVAPHDLDAEACVLSALMLDQKRILEVDRVLRPSDFYARANQLIAGAIWELDSEASVVDAVTVASRLHASGHLHEVGGTPYLAQITDATPAVAHVVEHATTVASAARIRHMIATCQLAAAMGYTALARPTEYLQGVEERIYEVCESARVGPDTVSLVMDSVPEVYEDIVERSRARTLPGRTTRIDSIDQILGGMIDGVAYVLAGRPSHGKTAMAWQIAEGVASSGALGIFLSQEMPRQQLIQRAIAQASNVEVRNLQRGRLTSDEWNSVAAGMSYVQRLPIAVDDRSGHTPHSMRSAIRRCVQRLRARGFTRELGIIVLDYLQIMAPSRHRGDSRSTEVGENMHAVTGMAREFGCPILVLSQLNREIERRPDKRPKLSDLGESGALEADAYGVLFVYREDVYRKVEDRDGKADVIIAKNRNGRTGTATLRYQPSTLFKPTGETVDDFDGFESGAHYAGDAA